MSNRIGELCAYLDQSVPELRNGLVYFTASSGGHEMQVCMSRHQARKMAARVIRLLDTEDRAAILPFGDDIAPS